MMSRLGDILRNLVGARPREAGPRRRQRRLLFSSDLEMPRGGQGIRCLACRIRSAGGDPSGLGPGFPLGRRVGVLEIGNPRAARPYTTGRCGGLWAAAKSGAVDIPDCSGTTLSRTQGGQLGGSSQQSGGACPAPVLSFPVHG